MIFIDSQWRKCSLIFERSGTITQLTIGQPHVCGVIAAFVCQLLIFVSSVRQNTPRGLVWDDHQHFHLRLAALPRSPFHPRLRAQKLRFLAPPPGCGAFKLLPVSRLYFSRPFFVRPPPSLTDCFSPRPTLNDGPASFLLQTPPPTHCVSHS